MGGSTMKRDALISNQYLAAELDEMIALNEESKKDQKPLQVVWRNIGTFGAMHIAALIGLYQAIFFAKWQTLAWAGFLHVFGSMGVTAGCHRLWSHKSYKAKTPLRSLLMIMNTVAFQNDVIEWSRDHRCHHKWTDTDADPHNTTRGFFYCHIGWLLVRKTEQLKRKGAQLDLSDLMNDPVLAFQRKHYAMLVVLFCFLIPAAVPVYFWGETAFTSLYVAAFLRYTFTMHVTFLINSVAHMFGYKPYDTRLTSVESLWTSILAVGEGGHNYHHTFPQDYRTSEYSLRFNWTTAFIDFFALFGQAYDLKTPTEEAVQRQVKAQGNEEMRMWALAT